MPTRDPELLAAVNPRIRKSPFFDATVEAGLTSVTSYNHMWLPTGYGDAEAEYRRLTEGVAMWDVAAQRHLEVSGPQADELVQLLTAVDITAVEPGSGVYAPVVDFAGTLINDPVLLRFDDGSWRFSIADSDLRLWIAAIGEGRSLRARVEELPTATLAIQGPLADDVIEALGCGEARSLDYFGRRHAHIDGSSVIVSRSGWSNQGGYELFLDDPSSAYALWHAVAEAGGPHGIGPGNPNQSERIESVLLSYGTDTGFDANPLELGLGDAIDLDGPPFVGQAALADIRESGPERSLLGVEVSGHPIDRFGHPTAIEVDGRVVGELRAAAWSPRYTTNLGLALVDATVAPGSAGATTSPDEERALRFVELSFDERLSS